MADIRPFRALRYHRPKVGSIYSLVAPPYDVTTPEMREELYARSEHNIVRVDYSKDEGGDKYAAAADLLESWERDGVMVVESKPAIYVVEDYFIDWEGYRRIRRGFIAVIKLEEFGGGVVFPHEKTFPKHKKDRMALLKATGTQFNPVFSFYSDTKNKVGSLLKEVVDRRLPDWNFRHDDGATRTLWTVTDQKSVENIVEAMKGREIYIADGHHRYETALEYSKIKNAELGAEGVDGPHNYVLMYLVSAQDEGLSILAAHRMLRNLPGFDEKKVLDKLSEGFDIKAINREDSDCLINGDRKSCAISVQMGRNFYCLEPKAAAVAANSEIQNTHETLRNLNVTICQEMVIHTLVESNEDLLNHISYEIDPTKVCAAVESGEQDIAIYLSPVGIDALEKVARAHQVMPQKSTYFFPKLITGLVNYKHSVDNK